MKRGPGMDRDRRRLLAALAATPLVNACRKSAPPPSSAGAAQAPVAAGSVKSFADVRPLAVRKPLRLGTTVNPLNLPLWWALDAGAFTKAGFDVESTHITGSASREFPIKLARGELDVAQGSPSAALFQQLAEGFDLRTPASLGLERPGRLPSGLLAILHDKAPGIKTLEDLRGKTVDGLSPGPSGFLATQALRKAGLTPGKDVTLTFRGRSPQDVMALVENKAADVLAMQGDFAALLEKQGKVVRWLTFADVVPWYQPSLLTASAAFVGDREAMTTFLEVYLLACRAVNAAEGRWTPELLGCAAKWAKVEDPAILQGQGGVPYYDPNGAVSLDSLAKVQAFWIETKQISKPVDPGVLVDTAALSEAVRRVGSV